MQLMCRHFTKYKSHCAHSSGFSMVLQDSTWPWGSWAVNHHSHHDMSLTYSPVPKFNKLHFMFCVQKSGAASCNTCALQLLTK